MTYMFQYEIPKLPPNSWKHIKRIKAKRKEYIYFSHFALSMISIYDKVHINHCYFSCDAMRKVLPSCIAGKNYKNVPKS